MIDYRNYVQKFTLNSLINQFLEERKNSRDRRKKPLPTEALSEQGLEDRRTGERRAMGLSD